MAEIQFGRLAPRRAGRLHRSVAFESRCYGVRARCSDSRTLCPKRRVWLTESRVWCAGPRSRDVESPTWAGVSLEPARGPPALLRRVGDPLRRIPSPLRGIPEGLRDSPDPLRRIGDQVPGFGASGCGLDEPIPVRHAAGAGLGSPARRHGKPVFNFGRAVRGFGKGLPGLHTALPGSCKLPPGLGEAVSGDGPPQSIVKEQP